MKELSEYKETIHSCSKCGLCQSVCPIYKITGNDCTVSRGYFIMLRGLINGKIKMSETINRYLNMCLKCNACSNFCPSDINVVDIIALAKYEYFKLHKKEKFKSLILKYFIDLVHILQKIRIHPKSKSFRKKVIYFGGCANNYKLEKNIIKILNKLSIEVISPDFDCCGYPFFIRGDMNNFKKYIDKFYKISNNYETYDILTNCAICEKTIKSYSKFYINSTDKEIKVKNVFDFITEYNLPLELKNSKTVTYQKPCSQDKTDNIEWALKNTTNLNYVEMSEFDQCCGFELLKNFKEFKLLAKLAKAKRNNIIETGANIVLTSCTGCKFAINLFSKGKYKAVDFIEFLGKNLK